MFIAWQPHYCITSYCIVGSCKVRENFGGSLADHVDYMPLNVFPGCSLISLYPIVLFGFLLLVLTWWRFVPRPIVPRRESRASCVQPPRYCATGCALVLKCVWMKLHRHFFVQCWNHFSSAFVL